MKKVQFKLEFRDKIESGLYKVITRDGRLVTIRLWDWDEKFPILAKIDREVDPITYLKDGTYDEFDRTEYDLFVLVPGESKLNKFEQAIKDMLSEFCECSDDMAIEKAAELAIKFNNYLK